MATKIIHKKSSTASSVPASASLEPGELAVNLADKKIYTKTTGGTVIELADGAKLAGIEAGATADQTASEILTAILTVDGSGSGLDADTLDGQHASAFLTGNQTITLSGDLTGSGTTSINAQIAANVVGADELNVTGNGTTSQYLRSDGDGSFTWETPPDTNTTYSAGNGISLSGTTFSVAAGTGLTQDASGLSVTANGIGATQLNVVGDGTTSQYLRSDGDGSFTWDTPTDTTYSAGNGISLSGTTFSVAAGGGLTQDASGLSHSDTSTQASVDNSGATVIQDVTLDTYGHVTALGSATLTASTVGAVAASSGSATNLTLVGTPVEDIYTVTGTTPVLEPDNGSIQEWTLSGNSTPTDGFSAGQAITLMIDDGTAYTITWPTTTWVNNGGSAPTLATTGRTVIALWKVSTTLYGALIGDGS